MSGENQNTSQENTDLSASQSPQSKKVRAKKGKGGSSKKMSQKEQSARFIETALELGFDKDTTDENFNQTFSKLIKLD